MANLVYLVTSISEESTELEGVFSTSEFAQRYILAAKGHPAYDGSAFTVTVEQVDFYISDEFRSI